MDNDTFGTLIFGIFFGAVLGLFAGILLGNVANSDYVARMNRAEAKLEIYEQVVIEEPK